MSYDVCIAGGGPCGAALALRLARLGHSVIVYERSAFDAPRAGESLTPGVLPLFEVLGIADEVARAGFMSVRRSLIRWSDDPHPASGHPLPQAEEGVRDGVAAEHPLPQAGEGVRESPLPLAGEGARRAGEGAPSRTTTETIAHDSLIVDRPRFDALLLRLAADAGADVRQPCTMPPLDEIDARFVVDASGRAGWSHATRTRTGPATVAIATHVESAIGESRVEALEDGWLWGAPLPGGIFSVMAFVDARTPADATRLRSMLDASELFRELPIGKIRHLDATTYAAESIAGGRLLRIGEASCCIDPLSSSGVQVALQSAIHAAAALHTMLVDPSRTTLAIRFLEDAQRATVRQHAEWSARQYAESRWRDAPFWTKRRGAATDDAAPNWTDGAVAIAPEVRIGEVPCLAGDLIEPRVGITPADGARPFVWLGGHELAPLLAPLADGPRSFAQLAESWSGVASAQRGPLFQWLLRNHVLIPT
jgi:flavin-dependent dehydrogenase